MRKNKIKKDKCKKKNEQDKNILKGTILLFIEYNKCLGIFLFKNSFGKC